LEEFSTYWPLTTEQIARADEARRLARVALDTPQPWLRFWARALDYSWFSLTLSAVIYSLLPHLQKSFGGTNQLWIMLTFGLAPLIFVPVESWCLSRYGTTPGKSLLQVQVRDQEGGLPRFHQAFRRSILVFVKGVALGFTIPAIFTMSYSRLILLQTGATSWDRECLTRVEHGEPETWRFLLLIALLMGLGFLTMILTVLSNPEIMEAMRSNLPK
jgi:uncharacterized RDD family membrane protein YckC